MAATQSVHSAQAEDRSSYQQVLPWTMDSFGFAKATEATGWEDPTFAANWANLLNEGKARGAYHFFHPELDPRAQAEFGGGDRDAYNGTEAELNAGISSLKQPPSPPPPAP